MNVISTQLSKRFLQSLPEDETTLFLMTANLSNEINVFMRLVFWSAENEGQEGHELNGRISMMFMMMRTLAGKVYEGHQALDRYFHGTGISREYFNELIPEGQNALDELKKYFRRTNLIHLIRRDFAFHFSPDRIRAELEEVDEPLQMYHQSEVSINNLFYFAEVLANRAMLDAANQEDFFAAIQVIREEVIGVGRQLVIACDAILAAFFNRYVPEIWEGEPQAIEFDQVPSLASVSLPWFVDMDELIASA